LKPQPVALKILNLLSILLFLGALAMVFLYAPLEATMNYVQKIFYFHVSNAWVGMLGFLTAAIAGIIYLSTNDLKWDILEVAAIEISLVFFLIAILSGSIWARPSWGP
jgi:heme exporter protein C